MHSSPVSRDADPRSALSSTHSKESSMTNFNTSTPAVPAQRSAGLWSSLFAAAALGLVLLYGVAFSHSPLAHNAAHDVRHVTVKPCH